VTFISIHFVIICDVLLWRTYETHPALSLKSGCDSRVREGRGPRRFGRKLDSGDSEERPRGAGSGVPLVCGEGPRPSMELNDRGAWPSRGLPFA
jgi:hypothetical protein